MVIHESGAALSIKAVTGKPIFYVGMGKLSDLEQFYPERMSSESLGMGDVMSLIERWKHLWIRNRLRRCRRKLKKMDFDFNDYLTSMEQMNKMGGISVSEYASRNGRQDEGYRYMIDEGYGPYQVYHSFHDTSGKAQTF